ncbi:sialate O-acetylesterase [Microbacterium sp. NPDC058342]|uniref:sialate O-acetylesterase n=1 Tax=Microbacterium sp. NPDC058342 TaxID=3346454 RepID=UPI0036526A8A
MTAGVSILSGAQDWQIFPRGADGTADLTVGGSYERAAITFELPMRVLPVGDGAVRIRARIASEASGASVVAWQWCQTADDGTWTVTFTNVPAGGPYRIETTLEYEGMDGLAVTRGDVVHHIGVGDVYVVAGQSNAAGRAKDPVEDGPALGVHQFRNDGTWQLASHPLNETTRAVHVGHFENHNPGHSPFLHVAKRLQRELGHPIGIVMAAYGGSPLRWWDPADNGTLTRNMLEMLRAAGVVPAGLLWYQGEADAVEQSASTYRDRFERFVTHVRRELGRPDLPVVTVQLARCLSPADPVQDRSWDMMREAQRQAAHTIPGVSIVPAIDLPLYDFIHLSAGANLVLGDRIADVLLSEVHGRPRHWRAPEPVAVERRDERTVAVTVAPVLNWINAFEAAPANLPFVVEDGSGQTIPADCTVEGSTFVLRFDRAIGSGALLHAGGGMNGPAAMPSDCMRSPMLAFHGLTIPDDAS